jgi:hypothetical protein
LIFILLYITTIVDSRNADALPSYSFKKRGNDDKPAIQIKYVTVLATSSLVGLPFLSRPTQVLINPTCENLGILPFVRLIQLAQRNNAHKRKSSSLPS